MILKSGCYRGYSYRETRQGCWTPWVICNCRGDYVRRVCLLDL